LKAKAKFGLALGLGVLAAGAWLAVDAGFKNAALNRPRKKSGKASGHKKPMLPVEKELAAIAASVEDLSVRLRDMPLERLEIISHDGLKLVGHWYCPPEPKRVIVAMHGWNSRWYRDFSAAFPLWENEGCAVLLAEQRAHGESEGSCRGFGIPESRDCVLWAEKAAGLTDGSLPIYLSGISMGATTVMLASELELPPQVRGITADCGFTSADAIWRCVMENNLRLPYGLFGKSLRREYEKRTGFDPLAFSCPDSLSRSRVPVLFFHGAADSFVPVEMTYENYLACTAPKKLLIVPGAGHGEAYLKNTEEYQKIVREFWAECEQGY